MKMLTAAWKPISTMTPLAALIVLAACNGPTDVAGIQGTGSPSAAAVEGPITGFGSIFVDGIEYSTAAAQVTIDGQAATESQLRAGQVVTINGMQNADGKTGTATQVTLVDDVRGPVTGVDLTSNTFVALGQTVRVTTATLLDANIQPADVTGLTAGVVVEVSGFRDASGTIVASRVDLNPATSNFQVKGVVQGLNTTGHTFQINGLTIDDGSAMVTGALADGGTVEVQGTSVTSAGVLVATHIEVLPGRGAATKQRADIDGIITTFTSNTDFVVDGQHVTTDANTNFQLHGAVLGLNIEVVVQGQFQPSGALLAQKVAAKPQGSALVSGQVDSVTPSANTLTILGVTVTSSATTEFEDRSSQHVRSFSLNDVHVGDYIAAGGAASASNALSASNVQRENSSQRSILAGVALNVAQPNLMVLGVTVATTAQTKYLGTGGAATDAAAFFGQAANHPVLATGTFANGVLTADRVSIEQ